METLELKTTVKPKTTNTSRAKKSSSVSENKRLRFSNEKIFDLAEYLRNPKGYVFGHAAFTK